MPDETIHDIEAFYPYGYKGREMIAVCAPFPMSGEAPEIVGRRVAIGESVYRVLSVARQITGKIHKGEPIGLEVALEG
ncbi:hypothetical protein [Methylocystis heyeri]|uniref:Uncharacterized protein n=1 Tax=Methylocystis heyeri TaxID=391905 RepID=A0A6B8KCM1_9HYPH|nr:hypothetical protein [Methylocystis heyeri]QGM45352.1 hypothetical protein H2LOC_006380 [Methylocystis heyeri]